MGVALLVAGLGVVAKRQAIVDWIYRWEGEQQVIADAFPNLLAHARLQEGWLGATCYASTYEDGRVPAITCSDVDTGLSYTVKKFGSETEAATVVDGFAHERAADQVITHPNNPVPVTVKFGPATRVAFAAGIVYTRFPEEEQRSGFVFELQWADHIPAEIFEQWWWQAPLGPRAEN